MNNRKNEDKISQEKILRGVIAGIRFLIGFIVGAFVAFYLVFGTGFSSIPMNAGFYVSNPCGFWILIVGFGIVGGILLITVWKHV